MLPFQIARAIQMYFVSLQRNARVIQPLQRPLFLPDFTRATERQCPENSAQREICNHAASSRSRREMPRNSKSRISVSSIRLFGQDAPAVMPITADPFGNQKCETTSRFSCKL